MQLLPPDPVQQEDGETISRKLHHRQQEEIQIKVPAHIPGMHRHAVIHHGHDGPVQNIRRKKYCFYFTPLKNVILSQRGVTWTKIWQRLSAQIKKKKPNRIKIFSSQIIVEFIIGEKIRDM